MESYKVINNRRTIREFEEKAIPKDVLSVGHPVENAEVPTQVSATVEEKVHWNQR